MTFIYLFTYLFNDVFDTYGHLKDLKQVRLLAYQAAVMVEISILLICFCGFDLFCPLLDKDIFIENLYITLSCPVK